MAYNRRHYLGGNYLSIHAGLDADRTCCPLASRHILGSVLSAREGVVVYSCRGYVLAFAGKDVHIRNPVRKHNPWCYQLLRDGRPQTDDLYHPDIHRN